jgi:hypothetical protein
LNFTLKIDREDDADANDGYDRHEGDHVTLKAEVLDCVFTGLLSVLVISEGENG